MRRLSRLVDALLKLSRLESRTKPIERQKVDLTEMLSAVVATHQAYINEEGLNLEFEYDPHVYVYGDADLLRQATANLISNAVRYTPEGGTITITARKGELMGQISVRDTGIGLTPEEAKMVFQRFWARRFGVALAQREVWALAFLWLRKSWTSTMAGCALRAVLTKGHALPSTCPCTPVNPKRRRATVLALERTSYGRRLYGRLSFSALGLDRGHLF